MIYVFIARRAAKCIKIKKLFDYYSHAVSFCHFFRNIKKYLYFDRKPSIVSYCVFYRSDNGHLLST